ncbi:MAG TPA: adenine phosphoribosyltransferase [Chloroflexota bacterium]|jgi:adenine phosphoribosyltransferase|nr:adenine phosphoribosyltransferase [Chloroflexota bacterium]
MAEAPSSVAAALAERIRSVPDFPIPGILFRDITTLLKDAGALRTAVDAMIAPFRADRVDVVVGVESRGFIFATPVAYALNAGFAPVRKLGRLPADAIRIEYELEYGTNTLELHRDAVQPGQRVLVVDDLLATGGTAAAAVDLVNQLGGEVIGLSFLVELRELRGRERLAHERVHAVVQF